MYALSAAALLTLALVSLFTGFRVGFLPFRLCRFVFAGAAALIVAGGLA